MVWCELGVRGGCVCQCGVGEVGMYGEVMFV